MLRDLVACERRVHHDLHGDPALRDKVSSFVEMLWSGGMAHEAEILGGVADGDTIVDLRDVPLPLREGATIAAMRSPTALWIAGDRIRHADLLGMPDLIHHPSTGDHWRAGDIKAGSPFAPDRIRPKPEYAAQVGLYAIILEMAGMGDGDAAFVIGSDGELAWYDLGLPKSKSGESWAQWVDRLVVHARRIRDQEAGTRGALSATCGLCVWRTVCRAELDGADDLTLIAGLGRGIRDVLDRVAPTVSDLAALDVAALSRAGGRTDIVGLGASRPQRFQDKARILRTPGATPIARQHLELARADRELHLDIETDPTRDNIVYLFGILERIGRHGPGERRFPYFFAHDLAEEREAFARSMEMLTADPAAPIYVYSAYERTCFRMLQQRHPDVCSAEDVEALFAKDRTIDLYFDVVLPHTDWPLNSNSIKPLAKYLGFKWADADASGAASISWFDEYDRTGDPAVRERIVQYNHDDCVAMIVLLDALIDLPVADPPAWPPARVLA